MIVADTNLVSYLLLKGARTAAARRVWIKDPDWVLPSLWRSEFLNVLATSVRANALRSEQAHAAWRAGVELFGRSEREVRGEAVLDAALNYGVSAYDAQFVVLAADLAAALVTGDRKLKAACGRLAVLIEDFGS